MIFRRALNNNNFRFHIRRNKNIRNFSNGTDSGTGDSLGYVKYDTLIKMYKIGAIGVGSVATVQYWNRDSINSNDNNGVIWNEVPFGLCLGVAAGIFYPVLVPSYLIFKTINQK